MVSSIQWSSEVVVVNISHKSQQKKSISKGNLNLTSNVNPPMKTYQNNEKVDVTL